MAAPLDAPHSREVAEPTVGLGDPAPHQCFTASATSYLRNLDREDLRGECFAVHYQRPPVKIEGGTRHSLNFPMLVVSLYFEDQQGVAEKAARILNKHWDDEE